MRPTPYRPRVPDDMFKAIQEFSDGSHKGMLETTLRYIREGIQKDRAIRQADAGPTPSDDHFPFPDVTIVNWAKYYSLDLMKVVAEYARINNVPESSVNGHFHMEGSDIRELNSAFFGEEWERNILLVELARMDRA